MKQKHGNDHVHPMFQEIFSNLYGVPTMTAEKVATLDDLTQEVRRLNDVIRVRNGTIDGWERENAGKVKCIAALLTQRDALEAREKVLEGLVSAMQAVVNAASIYENACRNDEEDTFDEQIELEEALEKYRALLATGAPKP